MAGLARHHGFVPDLLLRADATRANVLNRLARAAQEAAPGDIFMVTYAGHGGQIEDWSGDEPDNMDETWCLYDSQLIDDEIFTCLKSFAAGVRIVMISDSCHSGTVFRAQRPKRRVDADAPVLTRAMPSTIADQTYTRNQEHYRAIEAKLFAREWKSISHELAFPVSAAVVHLSGCMDHQFSHDGPVHGHFTQTLLDVWDEGRFAGSYGDLHREILKLIQMDQSPQLTRFGGAHPDFDRQRAFTV